MSRAEFRLPSIGMAFLIVMVTFFSTFLVDWVLGDLSEKTLLLVLESFTILPVLGFVLVKRLPFKAIFRWRRVDGRILAISGLIGLGLSFVTDEVGRLIRLIFPMPEEIVEALQALMEVRSPGDWVIILLSSVLVASFTEEMLFRGFFQGVLEGHTDVTRAVHGTAFLFAFVHFNPWWFVEILIMGVLMGVLTWRCRSIFPAVVVHMVNNAFAVFMMNFGESRKIGYLFRGHVSPVYILFGLALIVLGFRYIYRLTDNSAVT